jgi:hypothetical protein
MLAASLSLPDIFMTTPFDGTGSLCRPALLGALEIAKPDQLLCGSDDLSSTLTTGMTNPPTIPTARSRKSSAETRPDCLSVNPIATPSATGRRGAAQAAHRTEGSKTSLSFAAVRSGRKEIVGIKAIAIENRATTCA